MAADKGKIMMEDGKNYGDFLLETINAAKDQFSADELKLLQGEAEKIRDIGNKLAALEEKYPEIMQKSLDSDMNMPTDKDMDTMPDSGAIRTIKPTAATQAIKPIAAARAARRMTAACRSFLPLRARIWTGIR